jgi:hypothetical protein
VCGGGEIRVQSQKVSCAKASKETDVYDNRGLAVLQERKSQKENRIKKNGAGRRK